MKNAEKIARSEHRSNVLAVIAGLLHDLFRLCLVSVTLWQLSFCVFCSLSSASCCIHCSVVLSDAFLCLILGCICAGVGTRHYYRKLGFGLTGPYMIKKL